jgi:hypothetical protein
MDSEKEVPPVNGDPFPSAVVFRSSQSGPAATASPVKATINKSRMRTPIAAGDMKHRAVFTQIESFSLTFSNRGSFYGMLVFRPSAVHQGRSAISKHWATREELIKPKGRFRITSGWLKLTGPNLLATNFSVSAS